MEIKSIEPIEYLSTSGETVIIVSPSQNSNPLRHSIEIFPKEIYFGDTIYLVAYDENVSTEVIVNFLDYGKIPMHEHYLDTFTLSATAIHKEYSWKLESLTTGTPMYVARIRNLQPGEKCPYKKAYLEFPPLDDWEEPFWMELRDNMPLEGITCQLHIKYDRDYLQGFTVEASQEILIKPRPESEMTLLEQWYKNTPEELFPEIKHALSQNKTPRNLTLISSGKSDISINGNTYDPWMFIRTGNRKPSDPNNPTTLEGWRQLEASLTPSTMRDEVRLTRQLEYYSAKKGKATENAKNELIEWLKSLPEVQRSIMVTHLGYNAGRFIQSFDDPTKPTPLGEKYQKLMTAIWQNLP